MTLLGGVFFPVSILSGWLLKIAFLNPVTHALELIRIGFGFSGSLSVTPIESILFLTVFSLVILPAALYAFKLAVKYAKKTGSLGKY